MNTMGSVDTYGASAGAVTTGNIFWVIVFIACVWGLFALAESMLKFRDQQRIEKERARRDPS